MMEQKERTRQERIGGFLGLLGIAILLTGKILNMEPRSEAFMIIAGIMALVSGCFLIGLAQIRKTGWRSKTLGGIIFLVILYNLVFLYRTLFVTGELAVF